MKSKHSDDMGEAQEAAPWFEFLCARGRSARTTCAYAEALTMLVRFLGAAKRLRDVSKESLIDWQRSLVARGLAPATQDAWLRAVCGYYRWLERQGEIFMNPARDLVLPRFRRPLHYVPSEVEVRRLLASLSGDAPLALRDRAILEVLYGSGLRRSEMTRLEGDSIDLEGRTVRVAGKGRERLVPLTRASVTALRRYLQDGRGRLARSPGCTALWLSATTGNPISKHHFLQIMELRCRRAGLRHLSCHSLRRAFATHLLLHGASPLELLSLLGHTTYKHLGQYLRYVPQHLIAAHQRSRLAG